MSFLTHRQYETVNSIKDKTVEEILSIGRKEINTTNITDDDDFQNLDPIQQEAIKYIASRKRVERTNGIPYKNIWNDFKKTQKQKQEASDLVTLEQLNQIGTDMKIAAIRGPKTPGSKTPGSKRGGKKTHRKGHRRGKNRRTQRR